ncbi:MAG: FAD-dependent oxidoreductase [Ignavibacteriaceae bacterium]|nr:FAD-dependent oxidoreductase [Ignavibacteriaceae bacterium]
MRKEIEISLIPSKAFSYDAQVVEAASKLNIHPAEITALVINRRSIDARKRQPVYSLLVDVFINEKPHAESKEIDYKPVSGNKKVIVVGFGPAGMYAALRLIELNIKPIVIERGKDVQARRRDLKTLLQSHEVNPDSNYCFGEGGAGTYSDGKLYTRSTKRGDIKKTLNILVQHGAADDILIDSHPHIGSNKLPKIVQSIRETVLRCGGEINFNSKVTDFIIENDTITGVRVNDENEIFADSLILAAGHSARDIYYLLHKKNILIEPKPFAMGVRIEHPQKLINEIQYHSKAFDKNLPAASYSLACNIGERGVYSFCMCPGGIIVPAATAPGEVVVNGMSVSRRDSPFANSGFVVTVGENDWQKYSNAYPFQGLLLQQEVEQLAFELAGKTQKAPAQLVSDFIKGKTNGTLPATSYIPGLTSVPLHEKLPNFITKNLREALFIFDRKMRGYNSAEAVLVGMESRTSSPVRIPRDRESFMHTQIKGLFPAGEGAGYAGGIVSAAIDGENCANGVGEFLRK